LKKISYLLFVVCMVTCLFRDAAAFQFEGDIDVLQKKINLKITTPSQNEFDLSIKPQEENRYSLLIDLNKYKTSLFEISTMVEGDIEIIPSQEEMISSMSGKLHAKYTLVNLKPVEDMAIHFDYKENRLTVHSLLAAYMNGQGFINTQEPYELDFSLDIKALPVNEIVSLFTQDDKAVSFNEIYGHIDIVGSRPSMRIQGKLSSYEGLIADVPYNGLLINFEGVYPLIQIMNSSITQPDGMTFQISGNLDLTDLKNIDRQVRSFMKEPVVNHGIDQSEWTLKRVNSEDRKGTTELKYLLRKDNFGDNLTDEDAGILGIERRMEF